MKCNHMEELVSAYIDGEISESEKSLLESHVQECQACRETLESFRCLKQTLAGFPQEDLPTGFHETVMQTVRTHTTRRPGLSGLIEFLWPVAVRSHGWLTGSLRRAMPAVLSMMLVAFLSVTATVWYMGRAQGLSKNPAVSQKAEPGSRVSGELSSVESQGKASISQSAPERSGEEELITYDSDPSASSLSRGLTSPPTADRKLIARIDMSLEVPRGQVDGAAVQAQRIVQAYGGYIESSSGSYSEGGSRDMASFVMMARVPAENLPKARDELARLGTVTRENMSSQDVTDQYIDLDARLRNKQAEESRLLQILGEARTVGELLQVEGQLSRVRSEIEAIKAQKDRLEKSIAMSTISLTISQQGARPRPPISWSEIWLAFLNGWRNLLLVVARISPGAITMLLLGYLVYLIVRRFR